MPGQTEGLHEFQAEALERMNDAVVAVDAAGRITYWNRAAERLYGCEAKTALGRELEEVYECRWLKKEDEGAAEAALAAKGSWRGENIHITKGGKEIHVESTVGVLKDERGNVTGLLAVIRDIADRHRAEEEIARLARFPSENPNPVLRISGDGTVLYSNRAGAPLLEVWRCRRTSRCRTRGAGLRRMH